MAGPRDEPPADLVRALRCGPARGGARARAGGSVCEWKGRATYWDVRAGGAVAREAAWSYPHPTPAFTDLADCFTVYPGRVDACYVGDDLVQPQPGGFYGGWMTPEIVGPVKGCPGSWGW